MPQHLDDEKVTAARGEGKSISSLNERSMETHLGSMGQFFLSSCTPLAQAS